MKCKVFRHLLLCCVMVVTGLSVTAQSQTCPVNINFATGDLSNWSASTGLVNRTTQSYPAPNNGVSVIPEYSLGVTGIQVITTSSTDLYGSFPTIPTINGYSYNYSIKLGSTATSYDLGGGNNPGGFTRSVTYTINVPAGSASEPYTMTYAYALVLENGTHNSSEQPLFEATLNTPDSVITCASPQYYLPTFNNAGGGGAGGGSSTGATLDTATALAQGFINSPVLFLSHSGQGNNNGTYLRDVWTKNWTEVTFDLSAYRGRQVTITFQANNCTPGAHFAYAYVALRNSCAGLEISGPVTACANGTFTYSIPALANAVYSWEVPTGWTINSGAGTNSINVTAGTGGGNIVAHEINGCANLRDTITVSSMPPTVPGQVTGDNEVCTGINSSLLTLGGQTGSVITWLSSPDGVSWTPVANTTTSYTAQNLTTTTLFAAIVQNGNTCRADTSGRAVVTVDPKSAGGSLSPQNSSFCTGQTVSALLTLGGSTGSVVNWQSSLDNSSWSNFAPANTATTYSVNGVTTTTYYRTIVKSGVCAADTSNIATVNYVNVPFPAATYNPADATICHGDSLLLNATITIGTSYSWTPVATLTNQGDGTIPYLPLGLQPLAKPASTTNYVLSVFNAGCPNVLKDTFHIVVTAPIIVSAGNDTSVVVGQPLQLNATVNDPAANLFTWTPATGLSATNIANPVAILTAASSPYITYTIKAANGDGCFGTDDITVKVFQTMPDIFVPNAFTPNGDGKNDVIRPIYVGISQVNFFRLYNRWGQLVFSTTQTTKGWDGTLGGVQQSSGTFVYMVQGVDYTGRVISKRGTVILVR
ncbi:MAG: gliding motility-associated C-terminal domain-containing protein [Chitinophagaceae bacterium]